MKPIEVAELAAVEWSLYTASVPTLDRVAESQPCFGMGVEEPEVQDFALQGRSQRGNSTMLVHEQAWNVPQSLRRVLSACHGTASSYTDADDAMTDRGPPRGLEGANAQQQQQRVERDQGHLSSELLAPLVVIIASTILSFLFRQRAR